MKYDDIVNKLKVYQGAQRSPKVLQELVIMFLVSINSRILTHHGIHAECAVMRVLEAMFALPAHPILCLEAMTQLCRDATFPFSEEEDAELIRRINSDTYFTPFKLEAPNTQEGVV